MPVENRGAGRLKNVALGMNEDSIVTPRLRERKKAPLP